MGRLSYELIYFLEKGQKKLTPVTAGILVSNFHEIANKKGIQINLEMKDLLMSDTDYANTLCNKWLNEVEEVPYDETKYLKIIQLAREFNLTESINKAYKKIACHYFTENNYLKALKYFEELLPLSLLIGNHTENINILNKMGTCCYMLRDYNKALFYYKSAYDKFLEFEIIDIELEDKLLFNLTLCGTAMENYNEALMYMKKLESIVNESEKYTNLILKANILMKLNKTEEALDLYKEILNHDIKYLYIVQHNMAVAFMRLGRLKESIEFFTKSISNQLGSLSSDTTISFIKLADVYYKEKKYKEAFIFYGYGLNNAKKFMQTEELVQCYESIYSVCTKMQRIGKFDFYYKSMKGLYYLMDFNKEQLDKMHTLEENYISSKRK